jgi:hypothetical protein
MEPSLISLSWIFLVLSFDLISFPFTLPKPLSADLEDNEMLRKDNFDERGSFVEGDMILQPGMTNRAGIIGDIFRWPNATVVYQIDKDFSKDSIVLISFAKPFFLILNVKCSRGRTSYNPRRL